MARTHGVLKSEIWEPISDFRTLQIPAQWAYAMLLSQPQISNLGILPYTPHKWVRLAVGLTIDTIEETIQTLDDTRFTITDRDTAELLVRTFVKHDKVWSQPKLITNARRLIREVESDTIRGYLTDRHPWLRNDWTTTQIRTYETCGKHPEQKGVTEPLKEPLNEGVTEGLSPPRARVHAAPAPTPAPTPAAVTREDAATDDPPPDTDEAAAATINELTDLLDRLQVPHSLRTKTTGEPDRALAVARYTIANHGTGAYFRTVYESGDWPADSNGSNGDGRPKRSPLERALQMVDTVGWDYDPVALGHELDEIGVTDPGERRRVGLRVEQVRAERGVA